MKKSFFQTLVLAALLAATIPMATADPIHDAAEKGNAAEVRRLLDGGADINAKNVNETFSNEATPLMMAIRFSEAPNNELIKLLLERGANVNAQNKNGFTVLMCCVLKQWDGQREIFDLLIQKGAVVDDRKNADGQTVADVAAGGRDVGIVKELINKGAKLNVQKSVGSAVLFGSKEMLQFLLDAGGNPNADRRGDTPPLVSCFMVRDGTEKARLLLDRGADVNARGKDGETALLNAVTGSDRTEGVLLLLERGADVNLADFKGWTPLMHAVMNDSNRARIIKLLLEKGADIDRKIPMGGDMTIISVGENSKKPEVRELIKAAQKDLRYCLKKDDFDADATETLISSKNVFLPKFLSTATNEQKVAMLTAVEKQIAKAKVRMGKLNEAGRSALTQGKKSDASNSRERALQVGAYMDVLKEIKTILEGS